jgi:hypothetical protein
MFIRRREKSNPGETASRRQKGRHRYAMTFEMAKYSTSPRIDAIGRLPRNIALPQGSLLAAAAGPGCLSAFRVGAMRLNQRVAKLAVASYQCIQPIQPTGVARLGALPLQCRHSHCVQLAIGDVALSPELYSRGHEG